MGAAAMVEQGQRQSQSQSQSQGQGHGQGQARKRMDAADAAAGVQRGAWLPSAGGPPRRVNFRPALITDHAMATHTATALNNSSSSSFGAASLTPQQQQQQQLRPLNAPMAASKGLNRAGPSSLPVHEPLSWAPASRIGAGLSNLGNTCFLNSVLQCLTYTPPLAGYLDSGQHKTTCRAAGFCAMCALQEHVRQALAASGGAVSPSNLVKNLRCISKSFRMWRQEDAHEYLRCLIEGLHNCCLPPGVKSNSSVSQERSLIHKIFGGRLRSQVKCTVCLTCSNTYDPLLDLSLEIVRADSLTKALNRFTAVEALEGDNKYHCCHCRKKVRALKQFTIDKSPNILTIQFKRFSGTGTSGGKIDKKIEFGRTLDMKPYISNPQATDAKYSLYAVLVHAGWSTHSGHYYCFVRTKGDMWHALDDNRVKQVSEKSVLEQKAYILFYIKDSVTQSSAGTEQLLRNSLPAFKKLLSDGAGETADDSSADDLDQNGRLGTNALPTQSATKLTNSPPVRPAGNSQSSRNDTVDTLGGASTVTRETDGPVLETNSESVGAEANAGNGRANGSAVENGTNSSKAKPSANGAAVENGANTSKAKPPTNGASVEKGTVTSKAKPSPNGASVEDGVKPDTLETEALPVAIGNSGTDGTSNRSNASSALSSESPAVSSPATVEESKKPDSNGEGRCSTSGEDDDEDDTDWVEYRKHFNNMPRSYMKLLYTMPHTRRYFMARSLPIQRDRKRSACRKPSCRKGQCQVDRGTQCGKVSKRLCGAREGDSEPAKKQKVQESGVNGVKVDRCGSEGITVLRERSQPNGTCQAGEPTDLTQNGDCIMTENPNGSAANGFSHVDKQPESSHVGNGASTAPKNSSHSQSNGLYDFEVPRWGDADEANGIGSLKDIDRLLRAHKTVIPQRDAWDEEYDRGKLKKVRSKEKQAGFDVNPFQAVANSSKPRVQAEIRSHNMDD